MNQLIRGGLPLAVLGSVLAAWLAVCPQADAQCLTPDGDTLVRPLRDAVYSQELSTGEVRDLYEGTLLLIEQSTLDAAGESRAKALTHYFLGRWHQAIKTRTEMEDYARTLMKGRYLALRRFYTDREAAMAAYRLARSEAEKYLELEPCAEAYRLLGEILGQMLFCGDAGDVISIGGKARREVEKALEIDSSHIKAMIQDAARLAYTPIAYGGEPDEARSALRLIICEGASDPEDLFNIYCGFAMADFADEEYPSSISWFDTALEIYPGNIFASGMRDFLAGLPGTES